MTNDLKIVKLSYFKPNGTWYTNGLLYVPKGTQLWYVTELVRRLRHEGSLPGVATGRWFGPIYFEVGDVPQLILPTAGEQP
jgi:hypothetical protein